MDSYRVNSHMGNRRVRIEDPSRGRYSHRKEEPVPKSAVANYITQGHANTGGVDMYYGRKKRPAEEEIDIVKEKIACFQKIRKLKTISELVVELNARSSANDAASKYKHTPPPEEPEGKARAYYSCMPTSHTRLKITRRTSPPQSKDPSKKYRTKEDILQKEYSLDDAAKKYFPSTRNDQLQNSSVGKNISQSNQASHPFSSKSSYRQPSMKNYSPLGFSIDEDEMYQYSSPNRVYTSSPKKNKASQELPVVDTQVSQPDNFPKKLPLVEKAVPQRLCQGASKTTLTDNMPRKPTALRDDTSQKAPPSKNFTNREFCSAHDDSSQGPSVVDNDKSPEDHPPKPDIPQENHGNPTLKIYCDYMKKIGAQNIEGLTGNYCFKDDVFREWHEGLFRPTYGGELLKILPYSIPN